MQRDDTLRIELGSICIAILCPDEELREEMRASYGAFLTEREPDFRINLNLRNTLTPAGVKQLLMTAKSRVEGNRYYTTPELLECRVDWAVANMWVSTEREIFAPEVDYKLMNSLMRGIYPAACSRPGKAGIQAFLVHGCGIVDGERCYMFTGPSGSGKTTVARLAQGRQVLNDEAVLIGKSSQGLSLAGTPFDGDQPNKCNASRRLSSIFFLKHEPRVSLRKLNPVQAYTRLLSQVFDTTPLFEAPGNNSLQDRANLSGQMASEVASYELGFRPDDSFWQAIEAV